VSAIRDVATSTLAADGVAGSWEITIPGSRFSRGTYALRAPTFVGTRESRLGGPLYIGIGEAPDIDLINRSDLNKDGKVNLVDFSILLS
jgi:hypothetical protein